MAQPGLDALIDKIVARIV